MKKLTIGLTGGIASGKSTVLAEFRRLGARTFDCDAIARECVRPGRPALKKITRAFGGRILKKNGELDRARLASVVFGDAAKRKRLEKILHPEIVRILKKKIASVRKGVVVADIPLLFEIRLQRLADKTVVVWCPLDKQFSRLMKREGLSRAEASARILAQWPLSRKKKLADIVIDNSSSLAKTKAQVRSLFPHS